jgi:hypothetical protein
MGKRRSGRHLRQGSKCAKLGTTQSGKHMGTRGGMGDGAGQLVMKCEMCTKNDKEGSGWKRQSQCRLQRCRTWPDMH